jgi:hypothetical protein
VFICNVVDFVLLADLLHFLCRQRACCVNSIIFCSSIVFCAVWTISIWLCHFSSKYLASVLSSSFVGTKLQWITPFKENHKTNSQLNHLTIKRNVYVNFTFFHLFCGCFEWTYKYTQMGCNWCNEFNYMCSHSLTCLRSIFWLISFPDLALCLFIPFLYLFRNHG